MRFTLGDTTDTTGTDTGTDGGPSLLQQLITGFTQYKIGEQQLKTAEEITQENILRTRAGLPPLNPASIAAVPGINVGLSTGTQNLVLIALLIGGGLVAVNLLSRRR